MPSVPRFQAHAPQGLAEEPLGLWSMVLCPSCDPSGSFHMTRPLPVQDSPEVPHHPPLASAPSPPFPVYCSLLPSCPHCFLLGFQPPDLCPACSLYRESPLLGALLPVKPSTAPSLFDARNSSSRRISFSQAPVTTCFSEDSISRGPLSLALSIHSANVCIRPCCGH